MKDLNIYIEELLYKHQCVIIPKFGAFISNRKSAQMSDDKTFDPPKRELSFNASLVSNDGLLIKYISEQSGIDYNLVEDYINLAVEGWKRILQQEQALNLENIGVLRQTTDGRITFEPDTDVNYLTDSFGMAPFVPHEVPSTATMQIEENQVRPTVKEETKLPPVEEVKVPVTNMVTPVEEKKKKRVTPPPPVKKASKSNQYITYSAVAAVGLAILAYGAYLLFSEPIKADGQALANEFAFTDNQIDERVNQKISEATFFTSPEPMPAITLNLPKVRGGKTSAVKATNAGQRPENAPQQTPTHTTAKPQGTQSGAPVRTEPTQKATPAKAEPAQRVANTKPEPAQKPAPAKAEPAQRVANTPAQKPAQPAQQATPAATKPASTPAASSATVGKSAAASKKYQVIAGAFKEEKNATTRVLQLRKLGYKDAFVLGMNAKGLYQVSYGGYDSMDEAKLLQTEVKASKEEKKLDGGWILTQP